MTVSLSTISGCCCGVYTFSTAGGHTVDRHILHCSMHTTHHDTVQKLVVLMQSAEAQVVNGLLTASCADFRHAFNTHMVTPHTLTFYTCACVRASNSDAVREAQASALVRVTASTSATPAGPAGQGVGCTARSPKRLGCRDQAVRQ